MIKNIILNTSPKYFDTTITFAISDNEVEVVFVNVYFYEDFWNIATILIEFCKINNYVICNREYKKDLFTRNKNKICIKNSSILDIEDIKLICDYIEKYIKYDGII